MIKFQTISLNIDSGILWGILAITIIIFVIMALVVSFHWKKYSLPSPSLKFYKSLFWIGSFVLLAIATISLLTFESGI